MKNLFILSEFFKILIRIFLLFIFIIPSLLYSEAVQLSETNAGTLTGLRMYQNSIELGDIDNDGKIDLILTGYDGANYVSKIYKNNGSGSFTNINPGSLVNVAYSSIALGDIDNDGDLDLILTGDWWALGPGSSWEGIIYENDGTGSFSEINAGRKKLTRLLPFPIFSVITCIK